MLPKTRITLRSRLLPDIWFLEAAVWVLVGSTKKEVMIIKFSSILSLILTLFPLCRESRLSSE